MATGSAKIVTYSQPNMYGRYFKCTRRTADHLDWTKEQLKVRGQRDGKRYTLRIIQGCYNTGVAASAGTHDYDAVLDVEIIGMSWADAQQFLRSRGWAAWVRVPPTFTYHIHMASLPPYKLNFVSRVGEYVPGQINSYYNHTSGLIGEAPDNTWHPDNIRASIFDDDKYRKSLAIQNKIQRVSRRRAGLTRLIQSLKNQLRRSKR